MFTNVARFPVLQMNLHSSMKNLLSCHTVVNLSWLKKPRELLREPQVPKAVNGGLYGCKAQQPSCKRKAKPLQLKNANSFTSYLFLAISQVFCSSFWHHLRRFVLCQLISHPHQKRASSLQLLLSPLCTARSPGRQEVLQEQRSGQLTGVRPYGRHAGAGWEEKHSYQCQPRLQGAWA